jgi:hypothetical protein
MLKTFTLNFDGPRKFSKFPMWLSKNIPKLIVDP